MAKGIIVEEIPKSCKSCKYCRLELYCEIKDDTKDNTLCREIGTTSTLLKPNWCPIKPLPSKRAESRNQSLQLIDIGYNACLDDIIQSCEEENQ